VENSNGEKIQFLCNSWLGDSDCGAYKGNDRLHDEEQHNAFATRFFLLWASRSFSSFGLDGPDIDIDTCPPTPALHTPH
jgi:hypothetical protein